MYHDILIPTDGSPGAEAAVTRALDVAQTYDATVHVLHALVPSPDFGGEPTTDREAFGRRSEKRGREATVRIRARAADLGLETVRTVTEGVPYAVIREYVAENDVDLVVMGTHGQTGDERSQLGSTTERVVTLADVPVLATRLEDDVSAPDSRYELYDRIVVPTDGSDAARRAAEHGLGLAERYGADVHVIYVVDTMTYGLSDAPRSIVGLLEEGGQRAVEEIAADADDRNLPVTTAVLRGVPHEEIREYAAGVEADALVMGTRGRTAVSDRFLGGTASRVVRQSTIPVLTVP
jgi:nucleotide-binding universal stress UspA family protein